MISLPHARASRLIFGALLLLATSRRVSADAFTINVVSATASTSLTATREGTTIVTHSVGDQITSSTSTTLTTDVFSPDVGLPPVGWGESTVTGLFNVSAATYNPLVYGELGDEQSTAFAQSVVDFRPAMTGVAPLQLTVAGADEWFFSDGAMSMRDLTTGQSLWAYGWTCCLHGNVTFTSSPSTFTAAALIALDQFFSDTDLYELSLSTKTYANEDRERMNIQLSGLQAVPEPASVFLFVTGLAGAFVARRRRS